MTVRLTARPRKLKRLIALVLALGVSPAWSAETTPREIVIEPQSLATALQAFSAQSGLQVGFESKLAQGLKTGGTRGARTPAEALDALLSGTGLEFRFVNDQTVVIRQKVSRQSSAGSAEEGLRLASSGAQSQSDRELAVADDNSKVAPGSSAEADAAAGKIQEITVTATKRTERLQDVPVSIAVLTAEDIDRRGLVHAGDYLRGIPGTSQQEAGWGGQAIVIRGIETNLAFQNSSSGPTVATYFGETPTTNSAGLYGSSVDIKLVDIERVEVLRGPQGTAFGSASLGGAVRTVPAAPRLGAFEGRLGAGYSSTGGTGGLNHMFQAVGNVPLVKDKLAVRAVAYAFSDSGFYRNRAGSDTAFQSRIAGGASGFAVDEEEVGANYSAGARIAALFKPTDALRFTLSYLTQKNETDGDASQNSGTYEQTVLRIAPEHVRRGQHGAFADYSLDIANAVVEYDFGWADLLTTYSHVDSGMEMAEPFTAVNLSWAGSLAVPADHREHVGEVRLATKLAGAWNFLAGLFAEQQDDTLGLEPVWFGNPAANFVNPGTRSLGEQHLQRAQKQKAVFGEASWEFIPGLTLTGGVRAYRYDRSFRNDTNGYFGSFAFSKDEYESSGTNFRANLSYQPGDDKLLYIGWAQGFRLGVPQTPLNPVICDPNGDGLIEGSNVSLASTAFIDSDTVDSYELGGKFALMDRRLTIEAAVFRMEWSGLPIRVAPGNILSCAYLGNGGTALSEGAELQAKFQLTRALRIDVGSSWIHARLTEDVPLQSLKAGDPLPAPEVNANLGVQYSFDIAGHPASLRADAIHVDSFYNSVQQLPSFKTDGYMKLDASARLTLRDFNIDLYVRNLTNDDALVFRGRGYTSLYGYRLRPRTVGVQFGYSF